MLRRVSHFDMYSVRALAMHVSTGIYERKKKFIKVFAFGFILFLYCESVNACPLDIKRSRYSLK